MKKEKNAFRRQVLRTLRRLSDRERESRSRRICEGIMGLPGYGQASLILGFDPLPAEVDIRPCLEEALGRGLAVGLPRMTEGEAGKMGFYLIHSWQETQQHSWGMREPRPEAPPWRPETFTGSKGERVLLLLPGVAFSRKGHRLGRGGGYYDRILACLPRETLCVAPAFSCQIFPEIPREPHDGRAALIVTEDEIIRTET